MPNVLLTDAKEMQLGAQEPWPQKISVYAPHDAELILLPDSGNTIAVQTFLKMCNLEYKIEHRKNAEYMSPSGRVPFIRCGTFVISDFENIVTFVGNKGTSLSEDLTSQEKGDMRAYMSLINNSLVIAEQYISWMVPENLVITKQRNGSAYPWPLNHIINWEKQHQITKRLQVLGWANKSLEDVYTEVKWCCTALTEKLDKKPYFYSEEPTAIDALIFGHVRAILNFPFPTPSICRLASIIRTFSDITNHAHAMSLRFFDEKLCENSISNEFEILDMDEEFSETSSSSSDDQNSVICNISRNEPLQFLHEHFSK